MSIWSANKDLVQNGLPRAFYTQSQPRRIAINAARHEIRRVCAVMWRNGYHRTELLDGLETDCQLIFEPRR